MLLRIFIILLLASAFIPALNPARIAKPVNDHASFFSTAISYSDLSGGFAKYIRKTPELAGTVNWLYAVSVVIFLGFSGLAAGACFSLGELRMKRMGAMISAVSGTVVVLGLLGLFPLAGQMGEALEGTVPLGGYLLLLLAGIIVVFAAIEYFSLPRPTPDQKFSMQPKYRLFLLLLPFLILTFIFSYLPLWGWRYAFYNYKPGIPLKSENFVGFYWFQTLFENPATRADLFRVLRNTLAMSGLGIATSWCSMAFAIFLSEIPSPRYRRIVQTLTTIPNFISWVLVYSFAFAIFSVDGGLVNRILLNLGLIDHGINFLLSSEHIWLKMLAWGLWKGLGWGAIMYLAAIAGIDQQLYEAATVDGAGRFRKIWHITVPGLLPTYFVLLLLSIASILSNGMDQYLVFRNAMNKDTIEVLDLYVYTLGLGSTNSIPLATVISMMKSIISVILLFVANGLSKLFRGESIV
ncbi:MAG TPA: ABC transporter permease subunit [Firmicutes bacterium]|nr:ABC transporter permease subunit [Bacillota bacterium]